MPKPPSSVRSLRIPDQQWAELQAEAKRRDVSVNSLILAGVDLVTLQTAATKRLKAETEIYTKAGTDAIDALEFRMREGAKGAKAAQEHDLTFGPVRAKPGALLKGGKK